MRPGRLYFGDNLDVLRSGDFPDNIIDLIYLDPPFNSKKGYNVLFEERDLSESKAQFKAFEDTWTWGRDTQETYDKLISPEAANEGVPASLSVIIEAFYKALPKNNDVLAYLVMMAPRLLELRRVLKPTGSIYLHCDPAASHYLKLIMDAIFGPAQFRSEIIWKRTSAHSDAERYGAVHDTLLFYTKTDRATWNQHFTPYAQEYIDQYYRYQDDSGRRRASLSGCPASRCARAAPAERSRLVGNSALPVISGRFA